MRIRPFILAGAGLSVFLLSMPAPQAAPRHPAAKHTSAAASAIAPACEYPDDQRAFDIEGLKSQLMVTALVCKQQDKYNAFMSRYQPDVAQEERALNAYFKRSYGKSYQKAYDEYITNLADIQEQDGLKAGNAFCDNLPAMFDEVMSLHDSSELHDFANSKAIAQPVTFESCPALAPTPATHKPRRAGGKAKHA
jgi:hypothetical protein